MPIKWSSRVLRLVPGISLVFLGGAYASLVRSDVIAWGTIAFGFIYLIISGTGRPRRTPLDGAVIPLLLTVTLSVPISTSFNLSLQLASTILASIVMLYALVFWAREKWQLHAAALALIALGMTLAIASPVLVNWHLNKTGFVPNSVYSLFPSTILSDPVHPNIMATLLLLIIPLAVAFCLTYWSGHSKGMWIQFVLAAFASLLMGIALLLTRSRGGYLAATISLILLLWWLRWRKTAVIITFITIVGAIWVTTTTTLISTQDITDTSTMAFRFHVWRAALTMIADFPFTGVGMGTFNDVATRLYPFPPTSNLGTHNLFLQVTIDLGISGLIAYISLILLTLFMGSKALQTYKRRQDDIMIAIAAGGLTGFLGMLLHGLVDNTVWGTRMAFVPWLVMGLITAMYLLALAKK